MFVNFSSRKGKIIWFWNLESEFKSQIAYKIQFRPDNWIQTDDCDIIINEKMADGFEILYVITAFLFTSQGHCSILTGLVESYIDPSSFDEFFSFFLKFTFFIIPLNERGHVFIVDWCHRGGSHTSLRRTAKLEAASRTFSTRLFDGSRVIY